MRIRGVLLLVGVACLTACTSSVPRVSQWQSPDQLIVVAVANPAELPADHAASTPRGYDGAELYGAGGSARHTLRALAVSHALKTLAAWSIAPLQWYCVVFALPPAASRDAVLASLQREPQVTLAEPLQTFTTLTGGEVRGVPGTLVAVDARYNDPYFGLQNGFAQIDAAGAQLRSQGRGVRVAVIDTGVDGQHPDLRGRIRTERNFVDQDSAQFGRDRHGTEVAGVIAANANNREGIVGVAPGVDLQVFKACWQSMDGASAQCNSLTLAQALAAAMDARAQIVNLSLGGPADPLLDRLLQVALTRGVVVVAAVPPDGRSDGFPVHVPGVIAVDGGGSSRFLHAPAREVLTLTPSGHYDFASGSSLAAAHVSGAAALLLALDPHLSAVEINSLLLRSQNQGPAPGLINVCVAMALLQPAIPCDAHAVTSSSSQSSPR